MKEENKRNITDSFVKVLDIYTEFNKHPKDYGTGELLYLTEIHLLHAIGKMDEPYITKLAETMGVTKGAISQTLSKLEKKGYVEKCKDPSNNSRLLVKLTNKGKIAYYGHEHYHERTDADLMKYLSSIDDSNTPFIMDLFENLETWLLKCLHTER
ncbi:MAG: winged helix-turn-helix transcriptional regulator [Candidatus Delongbacteria bacterium]|nr:winged helix-turn-helix transcriptional regulator [Candidatus Delongbacteria bacterium]